MEYLIWQFDKRIILSEKKPPLSILNFAVVNRQEGNENESPPPLTLPDFLSCKNVIKCKIDFIAVKNWFKKIYSFAFYSAAKNASIF